MDLSKCGRIVEIQTKEMEIKTNRNQIIKTNMECRKISA